MKDLQGTLDEGEWTALGELFDRPGGPNRDTIFGLLHAVATAPTMIPPSVWLPIALGERNFGADPAPMMLLRHYNTVVEGLAAGRPIVPEPTEEQAIRDWCAGYMRGVGMDHAWIAHREGIDLLFPIAVLAGEISLNDPEEPRVVEDEEDWLRQARLNLAGLVLDSYDVLAPARLSPGGALAPVQPTVRRGPKVGRNEPCPCGSGKKHKKCCLRAGT